MKKTQQTAPAEYGHFINGDYVPGSSGEFISCVFPGDESRVVSLYPKGTAEDAQKAVDAARQAFDSGPWPSTNSTDRQAVLSRTARLIRERREELGLIECLESGKPITQALDEMDWAAGLWDYAAALTRCLHGETVNTLGDGLFGMTLRQPSGVCTVITPWNFPLLIASQKIPFALAAGCTCVVKPSEFTSGTTLLLGDILKQAGLPDGACNIVAGYGDPVGRTLVESSGTDVVTFTGSTAVGKRIAAAAGGNLKRVLLELGGKNPQIVFADAELDAVVDAVVHGVLFNAGQCCNSGSRLLVQDSVADELVERIQTALKQIRIGDPLDPDVRMGPVIHREHLEKIKRCVDAASEDGAQLVCGGVCSGGLLFEPTLLDHVNPAARIASEEVFGPVLSILRFVDEAQAVELANGTDYGLSAAVWTGCFDRAVRLARAVRSGTVWINTFLDGAPELPFGGFGQSGLGRELGPHSVLEFTELKTVTARTGQYAPKWLRG
jgi:acyl-CoA reductase-like NAD-dependent aldehyde dehydrogenase